MAAEGVKRAGERGARDRIDKLDTVPWRDARANAGWGVAAWSSLLLALAVVAFGAWWTARAITDGDPAATLLRFTLAAVAGVYYVTLFRTARRQRTS